MSVSMRKITVALLLAGLLIGCVPADIPNQPSQTQALAPAPMGAPGPTRVYDVPSPPTQQQPAVLPTAEPTVAPMAERTAEAVVEPTDVPVSQDPSPSPIVETAAWSGSLTILHTNDSVGYLDPCG